MKSRIIVTALLALVTGTAAAYDWQVVVSTASGDPISIDAASLTRHGNIVRAWTRTILVKPLEVAGV
jgi:ABC-type uncharacterized transport system YnjBCD substrate-binding protein